MDISILIARLAGPVILALGLAMATNPARLHAITRQFLDDPPLILISGALAMVAGLAMVNSHNLWVGDWRIILTLFGWALVIGGAIRILLPQLVDSVGSAMMARGWLLRGAGVVWALLGAVLCIKGYG